MSDIEKALLGKNRAYGKGHGARMGRISGGGTNGYAPNFREWLNAQPIVRQHGILLLLDIPGMYKKRSGVNLVSDHTEWALAIRALLETQPQEITGFDAQLTANMGEVPLSRDQATFFEVNTSVTMNRSVPNFMYASDKPGLPFRRILEHMIRFGQRDKDTQYAMMHQYLTTDDPTRDTLADMYTCSYIFIQPDQSGKVCEGAFLVRNSMPTTGGPVVTSRTMDEIGIEQLDVPWTGMVFYNDTTKKAGQVLLDKLMLGGIADPVNMDIGNLQEQREANIGKAGTSGLSSGYEDSMIATR